MQSKSHKDANKRKHTTAPGMGMAQARSEMYAGQEDQWVVLRHEVEEDIKQQEEGDQPGSDGQDTENDANYLRVSYPSLEQLPNHVNIVVAGVGGGGMNAVNRMIKARVRGVRFVVFNTDAQVLSLSEAPQRICLGQQYTKGLGAGGNAAVGARAATESVEEIRAALRDANLVFIAAGMGGGTGTGATPVVASIAKKLGALTIGIVTMPFAFEGTRRRRIAEEGLAALSAESDALITVPNDRLLSVTGREHSLTQAFRIADDVLRQGVQGIAEVINVPGLVNVDFADVRSVLRDAGTALMSIGQGQGHDRARHAAEQAIAGGFLNVTIRGAQRVLFNISGGEDMTLFEVNEVAEYIGEAIDTTADITFGAVIDPSLDDVIRVTLIAAGMQGASTRRVRSVQPGQSHTPSTSPAHGGSSSIAGSSSSQSRPISNIEQASAASSPAQEAAPEQPVVRPIRPPRLSSSPARPQRSLDDLRGLRSLGRQVASRINQKRTDEEGELDAGEVDAPPFLKKYNWDRL